MNIQLIINQFYDDKIYQILNIKKCNIFNDVVSKFYILGLNNKKIYQYLSEKN